jgi:L-malate glycosyltransferase
MSKIAFISIMAGDPWGGSEYLWAASAESALHDGHEVYLSIYDWSISHPIVQNLEKLGAKILSRIRHSQLPSLASRAVRKIVKYTQPEKSAGRSPYQDVFDLEPDVICISQGSTCDIRYFPELVTLATVSKIPYIIICHHNTDTPLGQAHRQLIKKFFCQASQVLFVAQQNLALARRQLALNLVEAKVILNPVNIKSTEIQPFPDTSIIQLASVARLDVSNKGQDLLLEALGGERWRNRDWNCNFYGGGDDRTYLEELAGLYGIQDKVRFKGYVNDVREIWSENHMLVLPSRAEGTPIALIEAMLCGRPAVVTDIGGNIEWINEGKTGFIAPATTVSSVQAALERAWQDTERWEAMGELAHQLAIAKIDRAPGNTLLRYLLNQCQAQEFSKNPVKYLEV